jgi:hypothetical protein
MTKEKQVKVNKLFSIGSNIFVIVAASISLGLLVSGGGGVSNAIKAGKELPCLKDSVEKHGTKIKQHEVDHKFKYVQDTMMWGKVMRKLDNLESGQNKIIGTLEKKGIIIPFKIF